jgi:surface antigen
MARLRFLFLAIAATASVVLSATGVTTASAWDQPMSVQHAQDQLNVAQARLAQLNDQVEKAQGRLDTANRTLAQDQVQQAQLGKQLSELARYQYTQPALPVRIMRAGSIADALGEVAQDRIVANRQQAMLAQQKELSIRDQQARDQITTDLAAIQQAQAAAKAVAAEAQQSLRTAQAEVFRQQAAAVVVQATSLNASANPGNHFSYGYCTWYVANRRPIPWFGNAIEWWPNARAYGYAEGSTPAVGAVMVTRESGAGHVAYVESVNGDGSWTVSEMNYVAWGVQSRRTLRPGQAPVVGFIYGKA